MSLSTRFLRGLGRKAEAKPAAPAAAAETPHVPVAAEEPVAVHPDAALTGDEAEAKLEEGVRALEANQHERARHLIEAVEASGRLADWAAFRLGLLERRVGDEPAAKAALDRAVARNPRLFWAHFERIRLPSVREDRGSRDQFAEAMLDLDWEELQPAHVGELEAIAAAIWRDGKRDLAGRLLARLWPSDALSPVALDRIAETALDPALIEAVTERRAAIPGVAEPRPEGLGGEGSEHTAFQTAVEDLGAGRTERAAAGFETLTGSAIFGAWANFYLGRIYTREADQTRAWRAFDAAIAADPSLFWAHFERAVLASSLSVSAETLVDYVGQLGALAWEPLQEGHVRDLERVAHALWDRAKRGEAAVLLSRLWPSEHLSRLALVRIVESGASRDVQRRAADRLHDLPDLDGTALRVLSEYHQRHGEGDRVIASLERAFEQKSTDFDSWIGLIRSYAANGERARTFAAIDQGVQFSTQQRKYVTLVAQVEFGDVDDAFLTYRDYCRLYGEVPKYLAIRIAYQLGDRFDLARRDEVLGILAANYPGDRDVALALINTAMRDQRWSDALAMFDARFGDGSDTGQDVRLARIDVTAYSGDLDQAAQLLEAERVDGLLPKAFLRSSIRVLSEQDRWDEVFDTGVRQLGDDPSLRNFLSLVIRAARKIDASDRLLDALLALPQPLAPEQVEAVHAVAEDLAEQGREDVFARIEGVELPPERRHRIALKLRGRADAAPIERDLCIYYCADEAYLTPALVSLASLAMTNVALAQRAVFYLVVDADVVPVAEAAAAALGTRLALDLEVVDASSVVSSGDRLRTGYGLFTGGQQLALAAYYRIFFARWLIEQKRFAQALYVDADTLVRGGLDELFALDTGAPLMARRDTDRPEVRHATALHKLQGAYFNSGILRFVLGHPDLPALLDRAIAAAIDPEVPLIFQDQCALNIGFDTRAAELPERFNYFNPPSVSGDAIPASEAVIVHFLDRPKPWDSLYRTSAREWFDWFELVEALRRPTTPEG